MAGPITTAGEWLSKKLLEPAVELGAKIMGRGGRASVEKGLEKLEPVLDNASKVKPKLTPDETKAFLKAQQEATAAKEATEKAKPLDFTPSNNPDLVIKKSGEKAGSASAKTEAITVEEGSAGLKGAAESVKTAATGEKLSFLEARKIAKSSTESLAGKLRDLTNGGRVDWAKRVVADARFKGMGKGEFDDVLQEASRQGSKIPKDLVAELQKSHNVQARGWFFERWADKGVATANYLGSRTKEALTNPVSFLATGYDVLALQWRAPLAVGSAVKNNLGKSLLVGLPVVGAAAVTDEKLLDGAGGRTLGSALNTVGSTYWAADNALLNGGIKLGSGVLGIATSKPAEKAAENAAEGSAEAASKIPGFAGRILSNALGEDAVDYAERIPFLGTILPKGVKTAMAVDKGIKKVEGAATPTAENPGDHTPAAKTASDSAPSTSASDADDDAADEKNTAHMSAKEKKAYFLDKGKQLAGKAGDMVSEAEMKKLGDMAKSGGWMGMAGAIMGFMSGDTKGAKLMNAMGLGLLFGMLGKMLGINPTMDLGHGGGSRPGAYSAVNQYSRGYVPGVSDIAGMGNRHVPSGRGYGYGPASQGVNQPAAQGYGPASNGVNQPVRQGYGPGSVIPASEMRLVSSEPPRAPQVAPYVKEYETGQQPSGAVTSPVAQPSVEVRSLDEAQKAIEKARQSSKDAPLVRVEGIERNYDAPTPAVTPSEPKKNAMNQSVSLSSPVYSMNT